MEVKTNLASFRRICYDKPVRMSMIPTLTLTLCLTHQCNLRCTYCYAGRKYSHAMSRKMACKAIDLALAEAKATGQGLDIAFFGGEPLLEWELLQFCHAYACAHREGPVVPLRFGLTTNLTLLTPDKAEWLLEHDFLIGLSVDGSPGMHDTCRRYADGRGSHADVLPALQWVREHPDARTRLLCVVTPRNFPLLEEGVLWLSQHYDGAIGLNFDYWSKWTDAQFEKLSAIMQRVAERVADSYRHGGKPIRIMNLEEKIFLHIEGKNACTRCSIGEREIAVSVDGNFFPCSRLVGEGDNPELNFGNVDTGIDRAKQNYLVATRGNVTPACKLCELRSRCMNTCGCTNYAASGKINEVSPYLCSLERLLIRTADTLASSLYAEQNPAFMALFYGITGTEARQASQ